MIQPKIHSAFYRQLVFWVGVIATISYRIIIFLNKLPNHLYSDVVWYIGTLGFVWYFAHRYNIENRRLQIIKEADLIDKINLKKTLSNNDRKVLVHTLSGLSSSMAQWNYVIIFIASGLALLFDVYTRILAR